MLMPLTEIPQSYPRGATVRIVAHLHSSVTDPRRRVAIYARPNTSAPRTLIARGRPNLSGNLVAHIRITQQTTLSAVATTPHATWKAYQNRTTS
jgi:hypothetical protein